MTREDALNKTIGILTYHQVNFCKSKEAVANMNEIIEALEKIDQEPCEDCISRESALDDAGLGEFHRYDDYVKMRNYLKSLPSVTPQQKIGRWIYTGDYITDGMLKCSKCGFEHDVSERFSYCPNCGANMQEEEE